MSTVDTEWFYLPDDSDDRQGPFALKQMRTLFGKGTINADTYVWGESLDEWSPISSVPALLQELRKRAAPPAPARRNRKAPPAPQGSRERKAPSRGETKSRHTAASTARKQNAAPVRSIGNRGRVRSARYLKSMAKANVSTDGWGERFTVDGMAYYHNHATGDVSWEKPDCLKSAEEKDEDSGSWVWVRDEKEAWLPAQHLKTSGGKMTCKLLSGRKVTVKQGPAEPLWPLKKSSLQRLVDDLVMLDDPNEAAIVYNLRERFRNNKIYTWVGASKSVLVSVNPFKMLPLYSPQIISDYLHPGPTRGRDPHVFSIANSSFRSLQMNQDNHAILISGESGAGKTEATKQCLSFLADAAGSENSVEQRILMANPVLEAYGNAKTLRNNNSSRFGKWIEVHFDPIGRSISSASIENFLLEKIRVVLQQPDERNYHIFYQLCSSSAGSRLGLGSANQYTYLSQSGCIRVDGIDDVKEFEEVQTAMTHLNFEQEESDWMFTVTAGVLTIGNVAFNAVRNRGADDSSEIRDMAPVQAAAQYLDVDASQLARVLLNRSIEVRGERSVIPLDPTAARDGADALAKFVYGKLFDWLVRRVNRAMEGARGHFIGVLDIFGFEIFENNSFEQLCINFCNEKLQQHFNKHTFKEEEQVYISEGVPYERVPFIDNQPVLDLIEKTPKGLLVMLDEEINVPRGTDVTFMNKVKRLHSKHPNFVVPKIRTASPTFFTVEHYAGVVDYDAAGFLVKNKDTLFPDMLEVVKSSKNPRTRALFDEAATRASGEQKVGRARGFRGAKRYSLGGQFRRQLTKLMKLLYKCEPWYIRCIKSNHKKRANLFENRMCLDQLRYSGVFEAVKIRKNGYPFRYTHAQFASRFRCITLDSRMRSALRSRPGDHRALCSEILSHKERHDFSRVQIGNSMVLYRAAEHHVLELLRHLALEKIVPMAQRVARGFNARRFVRVLRQAGRILLSAINECMSGRSDVSHLEEAIERSAVLLGPLRVLFDSEPRELKKAKEIRFKLLEWREVSGILRDLADKDPMDHYGEFAAAVLRASGLMDVPHTAQMEQLYQRCKEKLDNCASARIDPIADEALYTLNVQQMREVLEEAAKVGYTSSDIRSIEQTLALPDEELTKLQLRKAIELNDPERRIHREVHLKMLHLDRFASMFQFTKFPRLRDPAEFAAAKFFLMRKTEKLQQGMLKHTSKPLHVSLTDLPKAQNKQAVRLFKNVLGYMGDRKYANPASLSTELINQCLQGDDALRIEVLCQLMKQVTENPDPSSERKGYELLALCLHTFVPPEIFENFIIVFLRDNATKRGQPWISELHRTQYGGGLSAALDPTAATAWVSKFYQEQKRSRYSVADSGALVQVPRARVSAASQNRNSNLAPAVSPRASSARASQMGDPVVCQAIAIYSFEAGGEDESALSFTKGQRIDILEVDVDWWRARIDGVEGWVPEQYIRRV